MKFTRAFSLVIAMVIAPTAVAGSNSEDDNSALKNKLSTTLNLSVMSLKESPVPGLYEALTNRGLLYVTKDGKSLIHGKMYDLDNGMNNLTEAAMVGPRVELIKALEKNMLVYKAKNEKHVVTVFTDVSCGYCRKMHQEMDQYNDLGITIRYLAFPRAGIPSDNAAEMEAVWCAADPLKAMSEAKAGGRVKSATCDANIEKQYNVGQVIGVNGTPAIVLADGRLVPGYQPAEQLLATLSVL
ncbi:bifunctional protein-disulfide isomerase/oxidoreductase DsbC [Shewanella youngdeokensis]|uniref:Thiol:disulfide interchange protein n=1 Tax=Shewanella youngdeokensis TaxID=2999068 RepID=A0ABZ0JZR2_9GAMM|nr:bifunctional protein-disulfide isomerase/oxidoreductase DsbC [Shewanella sp. DAU334]